MATDQNRIAADSDHSDRLLLLMRHAKSDWGDETLSDHDRPLNRRGRNDAPLLGRWVAVIGGVPDIVLCSSALRTRQTVDQMLPEWPTEPAISYNDSLYLASPEGILDSVRSDACDAGRVMVVAHNPGMASLVSQLAGRWIDMPTAAIAVFRIRDPDWNKLSMSSDVELVEFMRPKAL